MTCPRCLGKCVTKNECLLCGHPVATRVISVPKREDWKLPENQLALDLVIK